MRPILRLSSPAGFATITLLMFFVTMSARANPPQHLLSNLLDTQNQVLNAPWQSTSMRVQDPDDPYLFDEFEKEVKAGRVTTLEFNNTGLDKKAQATAQVLRHGQTLIIRVRAREIPNPSLFGASRYTLWAYLSNYHMRVYLGDLVLIPNSKSDRLGNVRGASDSMFSYSSLPVDAVFGGLILTTEPPQYKPVISEALKPLLTTMSEQP